MSSLAWLHSLPPGSLLILGSLLLPFVRGVALKGLVLALPLLSGWHLASFEVGTTLALTMGDFELTPIRIDRLSLVWGTIFHIAAFLGALFALHVRSGWQQLAGLGYAGSAIAGVFAGDLVTLFVFWELTAVTSVFLVWAPHEHLEPTARDLQRERSVRAARRYLMIQVASGVFLFGGVACYFQKTGSLDFNALSIETASGKLILFAFGIKAAFPFLHNWLQDAYPEATPTGTVFLSAFTTKMAIYALARGFAGTEELIYVGAAMTAFPIFFAVIENDLRRVLAYSLNNQLGFMVVGVGLGTELALNGTAAHAFAHILYKALLFMAMGAVLMRTGTAKGSELGGLYKSMPWTTGFCIIGGAAISAFPLTSGFISKSLVLSSAAEEHYTLVWFILLFASAGVFHHSGIKIPFFAFFAHDSGKRVKEAPFHMLLAMGIAAAFCLGLGFAPGMLYSILPFDVTYEPYTTFHVVSQLQLLLFSALAFTVLNRWGVYPPELRSTVLDFDWVYRKPIPALLRWIGRVGDRLWSETLALLGLLRTAALAGVRHYHGPHGLFARTWAAGDIALLALAALALVLAAFFGFAI